MKFISLTALLAAGAFALVSCSKEEPTVIEAAQEVARASAPMGEIGSASMSLTVGDRTITSVTAVISGGPSFPAQTHSIDVSGENGVVSIFFGNLPVGRGYEVTLTAADCSGTTKFDVTAGVTTQVPVMITCPSSGDPGQQSGSARITGTIVPGAPPACDHVSSITATPALQNGDGPAISVQLVLDAGVTPVNIAWTASSTNGGSGIVGNLMGSVDQDISFDCTTTGLVQLVAAVTAPEAGKACTEQARVVIECVNQAAGAVCGDGIINGNDQCDGTALPPSAPAGSTCSALCTLITPALPRCGDGIINGSDECDGAVLPASAPAGSTCSPTCTVVAPVPARCGDGIINGSDQCDGAVLPASAPAGSSCSPTCTLVTPPGVGACHHACVEDAETAACSLEYETLGPDSKPLLDCVLGASWPAPDKFPNASCANGTLLSCYCGPLSAGACIPALPATLTGQCKAAIVAGTGCDVLPAAQQGACVSSRFTAPNATGRAMNYISCLQNNCPDVCVAQ